jgi:hypothetical protein
MRTNTTGRNWWNLLHLVGITVVRTGRKLRVLKVFEVGITVGGYANRDRPDEVAIDIGQ